MDKNVTDARTQIHKEGVKQIFADISQTSDLGHKMKKSVGVFRADLWNLRVLRHLKKNVCFADVFGWPLEHHTL